MLTSIITHQHTITYSLTHTIKSKINEKKSIIKLNINCQESLLIDAEMEQNPSQCTIQYYLHERINK